MDVDIIMECLTLLASHSEPNVTHIDVTEHNITDYYHATTAVPYQSVSELSTSQTSEEMDDFTQGKYVVKVIQRIVIPLICAFGLFGNFLNLFIFGRRLIMNSVNAIERGAIISLASLAVSDLLFCLITCLGSLMRTHRIVFTQYDFEYYYQMYSGVLQNVFIKTSTWLTMIAAISRYAAVCYPLWARQFIRLSHIKIAIAICFTTSFILHIPLIWTYHITELQCGPNITVKTFDTGLFIKSKLLNRTFTYIWAIFGFAIPAAILSYCNTHLIISFRHSMKMRSELRRHQKKTSAASDRFTIILIAVVILFIILISPSEILHFYQMITTSTHDHTFTIVMEVTNILQAINFSINFLLYSVINVYIRKSISKLVLSASCCHAIWIHDDRQNQTRQSSIKSLLTISTNRSEIFCQIPQEVINMVEK